MKISLAQVLWKSRSGDSDAEKGLQTLTSSEATTPVIGPGDDDISRGTSANAHDVHTRTPINLDRDFLE